MICDHVNSSYDIYTRVTGYFRTRIYHCCRCNSPMAIDSLPQLLLRRMFNNVIQATPRSDLIPVDLCVTFSGVIAPLLARIFFWSLKQTTVMTGVTLHLINIDVPGDEFNEIVKMATPCKVYNRPPVPEHLTRRSKNWLGIDAEWSSNWAVENCGRNHFVALSHFDLFFMRDFLTYLRERVTHRTGMLGQHQPFMILNRDAYRQSCFKFRSEGPFKCVLSETPNEFFLYHPDDPRSAGSTLQTGFDTGELLELEIRILGLDADPLRESFDEHFYHFSGGGRVLGGPELDYLIKRARMFIEEYDIPAVLT